MHSVRFFSSILFLDTRVAPIHCLPRNPLLSSVIFSFIVTLPRRLTSNICYTSFSIHYPLPALSALYPPSLAPFASLFVSTRTHTLAAHPSSILVFPSLRLHPFRLFNRSHLCPIPNSDLLNFSFSLVAALTNPLTKLARFPPLLALRALQFSQRLPFQPRLQLDLFHTILHSYTCRVFFAYFLLPLFV